MAKKTGASEEVRQKVFMRAGWRCEKCGKRLNDNGYISVHHRKPRGMGGSKGIELNLPSNLMLLCGSGTTGCHGYIESHRSEAYEQGWLVYRNADPAKEMVRISMMHNSNIFTYVYLTDDGKYENDSGTFINLPM
jgi:hypothetical protein